MGATSISEGADARHGRSARELPPSLLTRFSDEVRGWFLDAFPSPRCRQERRRYRGRRRTRWSSQSPYWPGQGRLRRSCSPSDELMREKAATAGFRRKKRASQGRRARCTFCRWKALSGRTWSATCRRCCRQQVALCALRAMPEVRTGMRTGDTTPDQPARSNLPDILTTPNAVYLMLLAVVQARETCRHRNRHQATKRTRWREQGAHPALSLEFPTTCWKKPAQRTGCRPPCAPSRDEIARFLGGPILRASSPPRGGSDMDAARARARARHAPPSRRSGEAT